MDKNELDYTSLNAQINLYDKDGNLQVHKDKEAVRQYFLTDVNKHTQFFHNLEEKVEYLTTNEYWDKSVLDQYEFKDVKALFKQAYAHKYRFPTFMGAAKFYRSYALRSDDGETILERYEDRIVMTALALSHGNVESASRLIDEIITNRYQPATPTFQNAGKARGGEQVSCFLLRVEDSLDSIADTWKASAQLSKIGGGVALCFTNLRERGAPLKGKKGLAKGIVPWMKILEDIFSGVDQLGTRPGAGAVYLSAHHPEIMEFLDTKRENADEKVRIKTLSIGVVVPDITFQLAKENKEMYLFSPYDVKRVYGIDLSEVDITKMYDELVNNEEISKKKISARALFTRITEMQFESGYPYIMMSDTVNRANPLEGNINMSNLCSEILQVNSPTLYDNETGEVAELGEDISCNLGSMNVLKAMEGGDLEKTVKVAMRALTAVSDNTSINRVPTVKNANDNYHSVGLGQMNLHGFFAHNEMMYGDEASVDFTNAYFAAVNYWSLVASNQIAKERKGTFKNFENSSYASGSYFDPYVEKDHLPTTAKAKAAFEKYGIELPTKEDWANLKKDVMEHGLWHSYRLAVPPTGSISYISQSTSSIHPIVSPIETRKEGLGRYFVPAPGLDEKTMPYYVSAFDLGAKALINVYAAATPHIDQGLSCTLFFNEKATVGTVNKARMYAHQKGIKTLYYIRLRQAEIEGSGFDNCVSCTL